MQESDESSSFGPSRARISSGPEWSRPRRSVVHGSLGSAVDTSSPLALLFGGGGGGGAALSDDSSSSGSSSSSSSSGNSDGGESELVSNSDSHPSSSSTSSSSSALASDDASTARGSPSAAVGDSDSAGSGDRVLGSPLVNRPGMKSGKDSGVKIKKASFDSGSGASSESRSSTLDQSGDAMGAVVRRKIGEGDRRAMQAASAASLPRNGRSRPMSPTDEEDGLPTRKMTSDDPVTAEDVSASELTGGDYTDTRDDARRERVSSQVSYDEGDTATLSTDGGASAMLAGNRGSPDHDRSRDTRNLDLPSPGVVVSSPHGTRRAMNVGGDPSAKKANTAAQDPAEAAAKSAAADEAAARIAANMPSQSSLPSISAGTASSGSPPPPEGRNGMDQLKSKMSTPNVDAALESGPGSGGKGGGGGNSNPTNANNANNNNGNSGGKDNGSNVGGPRRRAPSSGAGGGAIARVMRERSGGGGGGGRRGSAPDAGALRYGGPNGGHAPPHPRDFPSGGSSATNPSEGGYERHSFNSQPGSNHQHRGSLGPGDNVTAIGRVRSGTRRMSVAVDPGSMAALAGARRRNRRTSHNVSFDDVRMGGGGGSQSFMTELPGGGEGIAGSPSSPMLAPVMTATEDELRSLYADLERQDKDIAFLKKRAAKVTELTSEKEALVEQVRSLQMDVARANRDLGLANERGGRLREQLLDAYDKLESESTAAQRQQKHLLAAAFSDLPAERHEALDNYVKDVRETMSKEVHNLRKMINNERATRRGESNPYASIPLMAAGLKESADLEMAEQKFRHSLEYERLQREVEIIRADHQADLENLKRKHYEEMKHLVPTPGREAVIAVASLAGLAGVMASNPSAGLRAMDIARDVLQSRLRECKGYVTRDRSDFLVVSFSDAFSALRWCLESQQDLLDVMWPDGVGEVVRARDDDSDDDTSTATHTDNDAESGDESQDGGSDAGSDGGSATSDSSWASRASRNVRLSRRRRRTEGTVIFRGLRVRMGVHIGYPTWIKNPVTGSMSAAGKVSHLACALAAAAHGGQILCSEGVIQRVQMRLSEIGSPSVMDVGQYRLLGTDARMPITQLLPRPLFQRTFPPIRDHNHLTQRAGQRVFAFAQAEGKFRSLVSALRGQLPSDMLPDLDRASERAFELLGESVTLQRNALNACVQLQKGASIAKMEQLSSGMSSANGGSVNGSNASTNGGGGGNANGRGGGVGASSTPLFRFSAEAYHRLLRGEGADPVLTSPHVELPLQLCGTLRREYTLSLELDASAAQALNLEEELSSSKTDLDRLREIMLQVKSDLTEATDREHSLRADVAKGRERESNMKDQIAQLAKKLQTMMGAGTSLIQPGSGGRFARRESVASAASAQGADDPALRRRVGALNEQLSSLKERERTARTRLIAAERTSKSQAATMAVLDTRMGDAQALLRDFVKMVGEFRNSARRKGRAATAGPADDRARDHTRAGNGGDRVAGAGSEGDDIDRDDLNRDEDLDRQNPRHGDRGDGDEKDDGRSADVDRDAQREGGDPSRKDSLRQQKQQPGGEEGGEQEGGEQEGEQVPSRPKSVAFRLDDTTGPARREETHASTTSTSSYSSSDEGDGSDDLVPKGHRETTRVIERMDRRADRLSDLVSSAWEELHSAAVEAGLEDIVSSWAFRRSRVTSARGQRAASRASSRASRASSSRASRPSTASAENGGGNKNGKGGRSGNKVHRRHRSKGSYAGGDFGGEFGGDDRDAAADDGSNNNADGAYYRFGDDGEPQRRDITSSGGTRRGGVAKSPYAPPRGRDGDVLSSLVGPTPEFFDFDAYAAEMDRRDAGALQHGDPAGRGAGRYDRYGQLQRGQQHQGTERGRDNHSYLRKGQGHAQFADSQYGGHGNGLKRPSDPNFASGGSITDGITSVGGKAYRGAGVLEGIGTVTTEGLYDFEVDEIERRRREYLERREREGKARREVKQIATAVLDASEVAESSDPARASKQPTPRSSRPEGTDGTSASGSIHGSSGSIAGSDSNLTTAAAVAGSADGAAAQPQESIAKPNDIGSGLSVQLPPGIAPIEEHAQAWRFLLEQRAERARIAEHVAKRIKLEKEARDAAYRREMAKLAAQAALEGRSPPRNGGGDNANVNANASVPGGGRNLGAASVRSPSSHLHVQAQFPSDEPTPPSLPSPTALKPRTIDLASDIAPAPSPRRGPAPFGASALGPAGGATGTARTTISNGSTLSPLTASTITLGHQNQQQHGNGNGTGNTKSLGRRDTGTRQPAPPPHGPNSNAQLPRVALLGNQHRGSPRRGQPGIAAALSPSLSASSPRMSAVDAEATTRVIGGGSYESRVFEAKARALLPPVVTGKGAAAADTGFLDDLAAQTGIVRRM